MSRLLTPALLLGVAAAMFAYNLRPDRKVVFPFLDLITADPTAQGHLSVGLLVVLGLLSLVAAGVGIARERRAED